MKRSVFVGGKTNSYQENVLGFGGRAEVEWTEFRGAGRERMVRRSEFEPRRKRLGEMTMNG